MQPKRQLINKTICSLVLLVLVIAMLPSHAVAASHHLPTQQHHTAVHPCDEQGTPSDISEFSHLKSGTLLTDICQGDGCLQCSTCTAVSLSISSTDQLPLVWKTHYLSHQGRDTARRLERPPRS